MPAQPPNLPPAITTGNLAAEYLDGRAMPKLLEDFARLSKGKRIVEAGYSIDSGEAWPFLLLEDGTLISAGKDDEANGPGVLHLTSPDNGIEEAILCQTRPI